MFALREIAVSLTFFVLIYCFFSAVVAISWRVCRYLKTGARNISDLLFVLRVLPVVAATIVTFAIVIPSFQILEPRGAHEGTGMAPGVLGLFALTLILLGAYRVLTAQVTTSRIVARWLESSHPFEALSDLSTFRSVSNAPPLTVVGVRKPKVLVSESTVGLLDEQEMRMALKHEQAHIRSYDNLKKLVFRCSPFPGMADLEAAWAHAAELAADDAATSTLDEAVDLAAALVKLSRLIPLTSTEPVPVCTVGFVTGSVSARVARLLAWDGGPRTTEGVSRLAAIVPAVAVLVCTLLAYGPALAITHELTEWLVR